jgi:hypothetical protein
MEKLFRVNEWSGGFEVEHIPTGKTHWMSDGVDVIGCAKTSIINLNVGEELLLNVLLVGGKVIIRQENGDYYAGPLSMRFIGVMNRWLEDTGDTEQMMSPGDPDFREAWEDDLNRSCETLEAYFPEEYAKSDSRVQ